MANLVPFVQITAQDTLTATVDQKHALGTYAETADGRGFRYAKVGASNLVAGNLLQASAQDTAHQNLTPVAAAIGATQVSIALGASAAAANLYAEGFAIVDTTPDLGSVYQIASHPAILSSGTGVFTLKDPGGLRVAWTTSSRITLQRNKYAGVIQTPVTTLTGVVAGVAPAAHTAAYYGWIQTRGIAGVLVKGTPGVGLCVVAPATAAGAVVVDGAAAATPPVGMMCVTGQDGLVQPVNLTIE